MNYALTALLVFCLIAWGFVLVPPVVRLLSGIVRPSDSIGSFRSKMTVLAGSTPSSQVRTPAPARTPDRRVLEMNAHRPAVTGADAARRRAAKARRRNVFAGLLASVPVTFLIGVALGGPAWLLFTLATLAFGAYTAMLWQMQQRVVEQDRKVAYLPADTRTAPVAGRTDLRHHVSVVAR